MPRLLHTSDVHVGESSWGRDSGTERSLMALRAVVDLAIAERVDLVLFAGDTFDNNRVPLDVSDIVVRELQRLPMPSVILPGNHDPVGDDSVYDRMSLPERVHLVRRRGGETFRFPSIGVSVWGRPHMSYSEDLVPLRDAPSADAERWQVAVAHGHLVRYPEDRMRSYLIRDEDIAACGRHYVALGHWDLHHDVTRGDVAACYSGSPNRKGTSAIVDLDAEVRFRLVELRGIAG